MITFNPSLTFIQVVTWVSMIHYMYKAYFTDEFPLVKFIDSTFRGIEKNLYYKTKINLEKIFFNKLIFLA